MEKVVQYINDRMQHLRKTKGKETKEEIELSKVLGFIKSLEKRD